MELPNPRSGWNKITACSGLYRKADSSVGSKSGTIMWVPERSGIQQNETADRLAREGAGTTPIGPESFLQLSLSRFKSKIKNWIGKRKQTEWRVCKRYLKSQLFLEGPTDRYVQFINKLDRKHCRMLVGFLTGHVRRPDEQPAILNKRKEQMPAEFIKRKTT